MIAAALLLQVATTPPPVQPDITVMARDKQMRGIDGVIRSLIRPAGGGQIARFEENVCPGIVGAGRDFSSALLNLIRNNMTQAGAKLKPPGCRVNALVAFSSDPRAFAAAVFKKYPRIAHGLDPRRFDELVKGSGAIRSWQVKVERPADGSAIVVDDTGPP